RVTAPNLEDCGLLRFEYDGLIGKEGLLEEQNLWSSGLSVKQGHADEVFLATPPALSAASSGTREEILRTLLDVMRRALAVKVDAPDPQKQLDLVEQTKPRLLEDTVWYLDDARELSKADVAYPRSRRQQDRSGLFLSSYGAFGRYLKRALGQQTPPL